MARKQAQDRRSGERALLEEFLGALALEGRSAHSIGAYHRDLEALLSAVPRPLSKLRPADLREHFRQLLTI